MAQAEVTGYERSPKKTRRTLWRRSQVGSVQRNAAKRAMCKKRGRVAVHRSRDKGEHLKINNRQATGSEVPAHKRNGVPEQAQGRKQSPSRGSNNNNMNTREQTQAYFASRNGPTVETTPTGPFCDDKHPGGRDLEGDTQTGTCAAVTCCIDVCATARASIRAAFGAESCRMHRCRRSNEVLK